VILALLILGLTFLACNDPERRTTTTAAAPAFVARGVRVDMALTGDQMILRGSTLSGSTLSFADAGTILRLEGDASITLNGQTGFQASADQISIAPKAAKVELMGNVKARFNLPQEVDNERL
jgi:hypothetical protein